MVVHPDSLKTIITGGQTSSVPYNNAFCVSVSRDRGETWKRFPLSDPSTGFCEALACGPKGTQVIYAAGEIEDRGAVYRSSNLGISWLRTATAPSSNVASLAVHPTDSRVVYAVANRLYRSTDSGETWTACPAGSRLTGVRFNPHDPAMLAAGGDSGVVLSTDNGASWARLLAGLEDPRVSYVAFADSGRWLVAATAGRSCFAWPLLTGIGERLPEPIANNGLWLSPTVTSGMAYISWRGLCPTDVSVFDCSGRRVHAKSTISNLQSPIALDLGGLSAGVYRVILSDGHARTSATLVRP